MSLHIPELGAPQSQPLAPCLASDKWGQAVVCWGQVVIAWAQQMKEKDLPFVLIRRLTLGNDVDHLE